ncbi:hypothetical protein [Actinoplanes sp. NPDC049802]|uniref:hypothetical protein n=1 Tax=Actinoplanes sp. NPDC049802 TaxID=3154742 RepID=UPI0033C489E3
MLPAGAREAIAAQVLALLAVCVHQIGRLLVLVDSVDRPDMMSPLPSGMLFPSDLNPTVLLDIAVEVAGLRAAQRARAHVRVQRALKQAGVRAPEEPDGS